MSHEIDPALGIVSLTLHKLVEGGGSLSADEAARRVSALGWLAASQRAANQTPSDKSDAALAAAVKIGLLVETDSGLKFANPAIQSLVETAAVTEHLQPDYVDRSTMYDRAISHLSLIGAGAVPLLVELLGDRETSVARGAAIALGGIGEPAVGAIRWAILYGNARVRRYALEALSSYREAAPLSESILGLVAAVLADDDNPLVKSSAIGALSGSTNPIAIEALKGALSEEQLVRSQAEDKLKKLDLPEAKRALDELKRNPGTKATRPPPGRWNTDAPSIREAKRRTPRVFLSYARENASIMEEYRRRINLSGFEVWSDSERLVAGENWDDSLRTAISASDFVVCLLSSYSWDGYQVAEITHALKQAPKRDAPFCIPVLLDRKELDDAAAKWPPGLEKVDMIIANDISVGWTRLYKSLSQGAIMLDLEVPPRLRDQPSSNFEERDVWRMVFKRDFFNRDRNPHGRSLGAEWELLSNGLLVHERATGLTWVRSPVANCAFTETRDVPEAFRKMAISKGNVVPRNLRLPTLEEAANLMTPVWSPEGWYRHPYFKGDPYMLTCDTQPAPHFVTEASGFVWVADFTSADFHSVPWNDRAWPVWLVTSE